MNVQVQDRLVIEYNFVCPALPLPIRHSFRLRF